MGDLRLRVGLFVCLSVCMFLCTLTSFRSLYSFIIIVFVQMCVFLGIFLYLSTCMCLSVLVFMNIVTFPSYFTTFFRHFFKFLTLVLI